VPHPLRGENFFLQIKIFLERNTFQKIGKKYSAYFSAFFTYASMALAHFVKFSPLLACSLREVAPLNFNRLLTLGVQT